MSYLKRKSNYDKYPMTKVIGYEGAGIEGYEAIIDTLFKTN